MKFSTTKNTFQHGHQVIFIEIGDVLYFEPGKEFLVTDIKGSRPFHDEIDLFQMWKDSGIHPVVLTKNKYEYPYSYDCHVTWQKDGYGHNFRNEELNFDYSDRLLQYNYDKFNSCSREVWSNEQQIFSHRFPNEIEKFLQLYFSEPDLELVVIGEGANVSTGYPYWVFGHRTKK